MASRLRLHPRYRAVIVEGRGALLLSELDDRPLSGRLFERLIPLIDGEASAADLALRLETEHAPSEVFYTLSLLESQGFLTSAASEPPASGTPTEAVRPSAQVPVTVAVTILGTLPASRCLDALERHGVRAAASARVTLALTDSYLRPELAALGASQRAAGGVWLPARPSRDGTWIGPLFRSETGACWHCLEHRLTRNRPFEYHLLQDAVGVRALGSAVPEGDALDAAMAEVAAALAEVVRRRDDGLDHAILTIDSARGTRRRHPVVRRPQCPVCGDPTAYARRAAAPLALRGHPRDSDAEMAIARFGALVDPLTGVVHDAAPVAGGTSDRLHVWAARFGANPAAESGPLLGRGLRQSAGKGLTEAEARRGSLGEAIERYSWMYQDDEPRRLASLEELGADAIHPNACMLYSDAQYEGRSSGAAQSRWHVVPSPLDPGARIEWTPVWSLTGQERRYLPTMLLYGGYPAPPDAAYCLADPSGNAAGGSIEEAVLRGLLELVERDALAIWWYNRVRRPAIAIDDAADPDVRRLLRRYAEWGRAVWGLDLTTDLGIPAVAAVSRRVGGGPESLLLGFGAGLDPAAALIRALLELAQIEVQVGRAEKEGRSLDPTLAAWLRDATVANQPYLDPAAGPAIAPVQPGLATGDLREDIGVCERALAREGIAVYLLDQTRPDIGVPVVKVVAPGLRHFRRRFAPGRLYDVPVRLGWLAAPRAEADLNPIPFFL